MLHAIAQAAAADVAVEVEVDLVVAEARLELPGRVAAQVREERRVEPDVAGLVARREGWVVPHQAVVAAVGRAAERCPQLPHQREVLVRWVRAAVCRETVVCGDKGSQRDQSRREIERRRQSFVALAR